MAKVPDTKVSGDDFYDDGDDIPLSESGCGVTSEDEDIEYPSTAALIPILVGLSFQSFCIALVS